MDFQEVGASLNGGITAWLKYVCYNYSTCALNLQSKATFVEEVLRAKSSNGETGQLPFLGHNHWMEKVTPLIDL